LPLAFPLLDFPAIFVALNKYQTLKEVQEIISK
jgi:hypothetical protein